MVKTKGHFTQTEELISIAVRGCPFDSESKNMTPFFFYYSVFTVCPFEGGRWRCLVSRKMSLSLCCWMSSHLSSVICCWWTACVVVVSVAQSPAFPRASPLGGITPMSHNLFWHVCVYFRTNVWHHLAGTGLLWLSHCVPGWVFIFRPLMDQNLKKSRI